MAQHDRIKSAQTQIVNAGNQLKYETDRQYERAKASREQSGQAQMKLDDARKRLQGIRSEAFEQFAGGAPPAYGS